MSLAGSTNEEKIWNYLYAKIGNAYGTAGLMGNLYAESALKPKNLQNSYESKLGYTDDTYTAAVDAGTYSRASFKGDSAGYGLAQWTYSTRKANMYDYIVTGLGKSIGDLESQLAFLIKEIKTYTAVWSTITTATSVTEASNKVLTGYENPADQSSSVKTKRASYGQKYYDKYAASGSSSSSSASSAPSYTVGKTYTLQVELNVRKGAGTNYAKVGYSNLTADGKKHDSDKDGALDKGTSVTCLATKTVSGDIWMRIPSGWIAAYYDGDIYVK